MKLINRIVTVFRREPLGKVSMNVSMGSTVRCSFDLEDSVLRIVLKEAVEDGNGAQELVIYAIKVSSHCVPQRCRAR